MVDKRLAHAVVPNSGYLRKTGLDWFAAADNDDYLADEFIHVQQSEADVLRRAATRCYDLLLTAARYVAEQDLWTKMGIPVPAIPLLKYSLEHETEDFLFGRFDFAGGLDGLPAKLLEFNADTASLLPETVYLQEEMTRRAKERPYNELLPQLTARFRRLLGRHPERLPTLLISTLGHEEDWHNAEVVAEAARAAGFEQVHLMALDGVIFDAEEGIFIELGPEQYMQFDFWYKFIPWDFIALEEPELWVLLEGMIRDKLAIVINPAFSMLLQNKALLAVLSLIAPDEPNILSASFTQREEYHNRFVRKPIFGRMGENVALYDGSTRPQAETTGDYAHQMQIYQELAQLNIDTAGHRYQPSVFYTDQACAFAFRRQDDLIVDDDAEYVAHVVDR